MEEIETSCNDVIKKLTSLFNDVRSNKVEVDRAKVLTNITKVIISAEKAKIEIHKIENNY